jgi:hypothetical protein
LPETIRVKTPAVSFVPSTITGFGVSANFETVMFYFDPVNDIDLDSYAYQLYDIPNPTDLTTPVASGKNKANVFTISVTNSTDSTPKTYYGRVAVVNSAGTVGSYTNLVSSGDTPLIGNQYISSLTAAKITTGTLGAHTITLGGTTSIIKSSTYDFTAPTTTAGWFIKGNGEVSIGGLNGINFNGSTIAPAITLGSNVTISAETAIPNSSGVSFSGLTITTGVGPAGGIQLGTDANNQWLTSGYFRTGNNDKYLLFNPAGAGSLTVNGTAIQNGTVAGISAATNKLYIGVGNHANADTGFYVDSSGNFSLKDKLYWTAATNSLVIDGSVTIGSQTATAVSGAVTTANNAATAASAAQSTANGKVNPADVLNHIGGTNVTTISGGKVTTGTISSVDSTCLINLDNGSINFRNKFIVDSAGNAAFAGTITAAAGTIGGYTIGSTSLTTTAGSSGFGKYSSVSINSNGLINSYYQDITIFSTLYENVKINGYADGGSGAINITGNANAGSLSERWYTSYGVHNPSDIRLKNIIEEDVNALNLINNVQTTKFVFKNDETERQHFGFIAQQMNEHIPNAVIPGGEDPSKQAWGIVQETLIPYLVKSIQQLSAKVEQLESRLV